MKLSVKENALNEVLHKGISEDSSEKKYNHSKSLSPIKKTEIPKHSFNYLLPGIIRKWSDLKTKLRIAF